MPAKTAFFAEWHCFPLIFPTADSSLTLGMTRENSSCQVTTVTNADGRNQNVSRKDAKAQRDSLVFTVKIHPPHPDPPPTGGRGNDFHEQG